MSTLTLAIHQILGAASYYLLHQQHPVIAELTAAGFGK
jgi:hypothetical protein